MKKIVLINGSPKINQESVSELYLRMAEKHFGDDIQKSFINTRQSITNRKTPEDFQAFSQADAVILAFPLYVFCLPGVLMRFLEDYYKFYIERNIVQNNTKVYAIINCGFPEPEINQEASRVIKSFARHIKADFRFSVLIGGGGMMLQAKDAPFMKKTLKELEAAFAAIAQDMQSNSFVKRDNIQIAMNFPRRLYFFMGDLGWIFTARKNNLKKKDLYRKPYRLKE